MVRADSLQKDDLVIVDDHLFQVTEVRLLDSGLILWTACGVFKDDWITIATERETEYETAETVQKTLAIKDLINDTECIVKDGDLLRKVKIPPGRMGSDIQFNLLCGKKIKATVLFWRENGLLQNISIFKNETD